MIQYKIELNRSRDGRTRTSDPMDMNHMLLPPELRHDDGDEYQSP